MTRALTTAASKAGSVSFAAPLPLAARSNVLQRKCECGQHTSGGECEECKKKTPDHQKSADPLLRRSALNRSAVTGVPAIVHEVLRSPGQPLDRATRAYFEPRFGASFHSTPLRLSAQAGSGPLRVEPADTPYEREADTWAERITAGPTTGFGANLRDLSRVRVHTDARAAESARSVNARAYTVGSDVVFAPGQFNPASAAGKRLLAHELTHVLQQNDGHARPSLYRDEVKLGGATDQCEGSEDITDKVRAFLRDMPNVVKRIPKLSDSAQSGFIEQFRAVMSPEGDVNLNNFTFLKCDKIHLEVDPTTAFEAFGDKSNKTIGLSKAVAGRMQEAQQASEIPDNQKESLEKILTTLAHEKRHMTIKDAPRIGVGDLKRGDSPSTAARETYHAEEILVVAEELISARLAEGDEYLVPEGIQQKIHRLRNMIRNFVSEDAFKRVRQGIIDSLRKRYPSGKCDSAIVLGVLSSMDFGRWHECNKSTGELELNSKIPEGLNLCPVKGHICKVKGPGGEAKK